MNFLGFSRSLVETGDLDPVYIAAWNSDMHPGAMRRWLLAYGMFYHVGFASWVAENHRRDEFWDNLMTAAKNETPAPTGGRWPRASERRHFRGDQATRAVLAMEARYTDNPEGFIDYLISKAPNAQAVRDAVEEHRGFGGWASFKFCDLVDRVMGTDVYIDADMAMYDTPRKGAAIVAKEHGFTGTTERNVLQLVENLFFSSLGDLRAPPRQDRSLHFAELETALCKYKSHTAGRYPVGNDIRECREAAEPWIEHSEIAVKIYNEFVILERNLP